MAKEIAKDSHQKVSLKVFSPDMFSLLWFNISGSLTWFNISFTENFLKSYNRDAGFPFGHAEMNLPFFYASNVTFHNEYS